MFSQVSAASANEGTFSFDNSHVRASSMLQISDSFDADGFNSLYCGGLSHGLFMVTGLFAGEYDFVVQNQTTLCNRNTPKISHKWKSQLYQRFAGTGDHTFDDCGHTTATAPNQL